MVYHKYVLFSFLICLIGFSCKNASKQKIHDTPDLGQISIEVSTSANAKSAFEEGLLLLHSFQYKDAAEKFAEAQKIDSSFALAYWGEAMTHNHTLWREQNKTKATDILYRLGESKSERLAKIPTDFERDLFEGAEIIYGEGTKNERDILYSAHMEKLQKKYPDNHEVAAQYALSVLGAVEEGRDFDAYAKGAKIAQSIIDENPNHPGALHYLIHSYDDPENAPKALDAANRYSKVAPDANHALHMPSHIYVALGMWDDVISSNKAAFAASDKRKKEKELDNDALDFHSLKWLMYGHLQKGEFDEARKLVEKMEAYCHQEQSKKALAHLVMMKGAYFSETENWGDALSQDTFDYSKMSVQIMAVHNFNEAMRAYNKKDANDINKQIQLTKASIADAQKKVMAGGAAMCGANYNRSMPTQLHIDRATVMQKEMEALIALLNNDGPTFETLMKEATELEDLTSYKYGPPEIVKPSSEMYAEWLIENGRTEEAKIHLEKVLKRAPKRLIVMNAIDRIVTNS